MNKQDLVSAMSEKSGLPKKVSEFAINSFVESISDALAKGESVQLIGFGTFKVGKRNARKGRNPQTGKEIKIAAKKGCFCGISRKSKQIKEKKEHFHWKCSHRTDFCRSQKKQEQRKGNELHRSR